LQQKANNRTSTNKIMIGDAILLRKHARKSIFLSLNMSRR
jgi:hypothetical protein